MKVDLNNGTWFAFIAKCILYFNAIVGISLIVFCAGISLYDLGYMGFLGLICIVLFCIGISTP